MSDRPFSLGTGPSFRLGLKLAGARIGAGWVVGRPGCGQRPNATPKERAVQSGYCAREPSEPSARVDRRAVLVDAEVQVAAGRVARGARVADELATVHVATELHDARQVVVGRDEVHAAVDAVVDDHLVAPAARAPAGPDDLTGRRGIHRRAAGDAPVEPVV